VRADVCLHDPSTRHIARRGVSPLDASLGDCTEAFAEVDFEPKLRSAVSEIRGKWFCERGKDMEPFPTLRDLDGGACKVAAHFQREIRPLGILEAMIDVDEDKGVSVGKHKSHPTEVIVGANGGLAIRITVPVFRCLRVNGKSPSITWYFPSIVSDPPVYPLIERLHPRERIVHVFPQ